MHQTKTKAEVIIPLGHFRKGAGSVVEKGRAAAIESLDELSAAIPSCDLLFLIAGLGGGTGSGAAPIVAKLAHDKNIFTIALVTTPFSFEGSKRKNAAVSAISTIRAIVDCTVPIDNQCLLEIKPPPVNPTFCNVLGLSNVLLHQALIAICGGTNKDGLVNLKSTDPRKILQNHRLAAFGYGRGTGKFSERNAVEIAVESPFLKAISMQNTQRALVTVCNPRISVSEEFFKIKAILQKVTPESCHIVLNTAYDKSQEVSASIMLFGDFQNII